MVFHWNYEFELYPQPAHRSLARYLIDLGVHGVIGHHSHLASHIEIYKNRVIAYGLGNWMFSQGVFFNGGLKFPPVSFSQLALDFQEETTAYEVQFDPKKNRLNCLRSENVLSDALWCKPEYSNFTNQEYEVWFRANRKKNKLLPIYYSYNDGTINYTKDLINFVRQQGIDFSVKVGLKSLKRSI